MKRYVLTGAPGAGKTALLRLMERRGYAVVEEAATDVIALAQAQGEGEPWNGPSFIDDVVTLQRLREHRARRLPDDVVLFDRSPICTWALCVFLGRAPPESLVEEMRRIERDRVYERRVFFIENLGHCAPTDARRITFEDSLRFEAIHAETYRRFGYDCMRIPPGDLEIRLQAVEGSLPAPTSPDRPAPDRPAAG